MIVAVAPVVAAAPVAAETDCDDEDGDVPIFVIVLGSLNAMEYVD